MTIAAAAVNQNSQSVLALFFAAATAPPAGRQMMFRAFWWWDKNQRPLDVLCYCVDLICFVSLSSSCLQLYAAVCVLLSVSVARRQTDRQTNGRTRCLTGIYLICFPAFVGRVVDKHFECEVQRRDVIPGESTAALLPVGTNV